MVQVNIQMIHQYNRGLGLGMVGVGAVWARAYQVLWPTTYMHSLNDEVSEQWKWAVKIWKESKISSSTPILSIKKAIETRKPSKNSQGTVLRHKEELKVANIFHCPTVKKHWRHLRTIDIFPNIKQ